MHHKQTHMMTSSKQRKNIWLAFAQTSPNYAATQLWFGVHVKRERNVLSKVMTLQRCPSHDRTCERTDTLRYRPEPYDPRCVITRHH